MKTNLPQSARCRLILQGSAQACSWDDWLEAPSIRSGCEGRLFIEGGLPDQAALFGLLACLRDMGLTIVSVEIIQPSRKEKTMKSNLVNTIFKAVALGMGVAVIVLSILGMLTPNTGVLLLGIGLFCLSLTALDRKRA